MMVGDPGSVALATMALQGLVDKRDALRVVTANREVDAEWNEVSWLNKGDGLIPSHVDQSVSRALEQAQADSCASRLAQSAGEAGLAEKFARRARIIEKYWNPSQRLFGKKKNRLFTEGTPLQYSFAVPFDVPLLTKLRGGAQRFREDLEYFFTEAPQPSTADANVDGERSLHGDSPANEPCMHIPYLFNYAGAPWRTQEVVDQLVKKSYSSRHAGLPGNDDLGAMSAWLVLSMIGLYPVDPCSGEYTLGRPFVERARLRVRGGELRLLVHSQGDEHKYVARAEWNGQRLTAPVLEFGALAAGGKLEIWMTPDRAAADWQSTVNRTDLQHETLLRRSSRLRRRP